METNNIITGDCIEKLKSIDANKVDLVYFDPPFFTQKKHSLSNRDNSKTYEFDDKYDSLEVYLLLIEKALIESKRVLKDTGSVFLHCDKTASHHIRTVLDKVFGSENFQSEIVSASDHGSDFILRCHIYRMDCRRGNFYKCLCMIRSFQVSLTDFPESPVITRFCNVVELTPFIDFHSLRTVLAVSDQISPFTQTGLLCN